MLFNSVEFVLFFVLVYALYLHLAHRAQNRALLLASYVFYCWWDWRFVGLLLLSTGVDYVAGILLERSGEGKRPVFPLIASAG